MFFYLLLALFLFTLPFAIAAKSYAPWIPVASKDINRILKLLNLKPAQIFYELGCGDGRVVCAVAKKFPQNLCVGLELAFPMFLISLIRRHLTSCPNLEIKNANLFSTDISNADVVYIYGLPKIINSRLREKLEKELKPGALVISYAFQIEAWQPLKTDRPTDRDLPIFVYRM